MCTLPVLHLHPWTKLGVHHADWVWIAMEIALEEDETDEAELPGGWACHRYLRREQIFGSGIATVAVNGQVQGQRPAGPTEDAYRISRAKSREKAVPTAERSLDLVSALLRTSPALFQPYRGLVQHSRSRRHLDRPLLL